MATEELKEAIKESIRELIEGLKHLKETKDDLDELGVHVIGVDMGFRTFNSDYWNKEILSMEEAKLASFAIPYIHLGNGLNKVADFFDSTCYQENKGNYEKFSIIDGVKFLQLPDKKIESFEFEGIKEMKKNE